MAGQNISHEGHRQRMRARVEQYGLESLAPHEALEYLLYITNARRDTNGIAHALLERFGYRLRYDTACPSCYAEYQKDRLKESEDL